MLKQLYQQRFVSLMMEQRDVAANGIQQVDKLLVADMIITAL